jgi:hypothetical protein
MLVYCYESRADMDTQELIWLAIKDKQGWMSAGPMQGICLYYIPEHLVTWCLLIDSNMRRYKHNDWIV